jgi:hypothetical protein
MKASALGLGLAVALATSPVLALPTAPAAGPVTGGVRAAPSAPRRAKVIAATLFAGLVGAGGVLYRRLGNQAQSEEVEALLDAEFARLEKSDQQPLNEHPGGPA